MFLNQGNALWGYFVISAKHLTLCVYLNYNCMESVMLLVRTDRKQYVNIYVYKKYVYRK